MKIGIKNIILATLISSMGLLSSLPSAVLAVDESMLRATPTQQDDVTVINSDQDTIDTVTSATLPESVFSIEKDTDEESIFRFGSNLIAAGNNLRLATDNPGILFAFGNNLQVSAQTEYAFVFGNGIDFSANVLHDVFIAGNSVKLSSNAQIGRDVYVASYEFIDEVDLPRNLAVTANHIILRDVTIHGDVEFAAENITFEGKVSILGKLRYNDNAQVTGLSNVKAAETEIYIHRDYTPTAAELWLRKFISMIALFVVTLICLFIFPHTAKQIARSTNWRCLGINFCIGLVAIFIMPVVAVLLFFSPYTAPAGIIILVTYVIMLYLAQGFAATWLGQAIVEKLCHSKLPILVESLIGILILGCLTMIPNVSVMVTALAAICGFGLMITRLQSMRKNPDAGVVLDDANEDHSSKAQKTPKPAAIAKGNRAGKAPSGQSKTSKASKSTKKSQDSKE